MVVGTRKFEAVHGCKPKGFGVWAFDVARRVEYASGWKTEESVVFTPHAMSFSEAKRWFRAAVMTRDVVDVSVGS